MQRDIFWHPGEAILVKLDPLDVEGTQDLIESPETRFQHPNTPQLAYKLPLKRCNSAVWLFVPHKQVSPTPAHTATVQALWMTTMRLILVCASPNVDNRGGERGEIGTPGVVEWVFRSGLATKKQTSSRASR